jgi:phosphatidylinositol alpha-1,6-mannosyltransferase
MSRQLLLTYDFPPIGGGIARWMGELAKHYPAGSLVVSTGFHPDALSTDSQFPNQIDRLPTRARRLRTFPNLVRWSKRATALARALDVEFTWCGNLKPAGYPARWLALRVGIPYGLVVHGGDLLILQQQVGESALKRQTTRTLLRSASVIVANSRWTADLCRSLLNTLGLGGPENRVRVVPLGSDPEYFRPGINARDVRERYGLDGRRWLMTVARLTPHKGIDTGLRVLAELRDSYPNLAYAVIGFGQELAALQHMARQLGVSDRVLFLTNVPDRDLPGLYNCAEIYLGLSRQMTRNVEGFGISLVEAGACGVPVIGGRTGGIPDAVRHGETGLLVDSEQPEDVSTAVRSLLDNKALANRLGAGGRHAVETYYNWQRVAADLSGIGRELGKAARREVVR